MTGTTRGEIDSCRTQPSFERRVRGRQPDLSPSCSLGPGPPYRSDDETPLILGPHPRVWTPFLQSEVYDHPGSLFCSRVTKPYSRFQSLSSRGRCDDVTQKDLTGTRPRRGQSPGSVLSDSTINTGDVTPPLFLPHPPVRRSVDAEIVCYQWKQGEVLHGELVNMRLLGFARTPSSPFSV